LPFIIRKTSQCPASKPYGVFTETAHGSGETKPGSLHGCHPTIEHARTQQSALYVNVPEARVSEGEYVDHSGKHVQFTDSQTVQLVTDYYQFIDQEYKGSTSVDAQRLEDILRDLHAGKPLDQDEWNVLSDLKRRYGKQFDQWVKAGRDGQDARIPEGPGRVSEALVFVDPSVLARVREAGSTKLWVDDTRKPPDDSWRWAQNAQAAEAIIQNGEIGTVSIDFDLNRSPSSSKTDRSAANGADFCAWMSRHGYLPPKIKIEIHSANPAGIREMLHALDLTDEQVTIEPYVPDASVPEDVTERKARESDYSTPSTTPKDKGGTAAHLLDSVLHDLAHVQRHVARILEPDVQASKDSIKFNAEHALNHVESGADHAHKLDDHLAQEPSDPKIWKQERAAITDVRMPNFLKEVEPYLTPDVISQLRESRPPPPPNLRKAPHDERKEAAGQLVRECGTCEMFNLTSAPNGNCWAYGNFKVEECWVCDSWEQDPNWRAQDRAAEPPHPELGML